MHSPREDEIFVFGSNLAGRHGAGAALTARKKFGAIYGRGCGPQGRAYAVPTKDWEMVSLPLERIRLEVYDFLQYARARPERKFFVTKVGCGLAGYKDEEIAPMFAGAPENCRLPPPWKRILKAG